MPSTLYSFKKKAISKEPSTKNWYQIFKDGLPSIIVALITSLASFGVAIFLGYNNLLTSREQIESQQKINNKNFENSLLVQKKSFENQIEIMKSNFNHSIEMAKVEMAKTDHEKIFSEKIELKIERNESANYIMKDIFASVELLDKIADNITNSVLSKKEFIEKAYATQRKTDYLYLRHYFDLFLDKVPNEKIEKLDNNSGALCVEYYKSLNFIKSYMQVYTNIIDELSEKIDGDEILFYKAYLKMNDEQLFDYFTETKYIVYQTINLELSYRIYDAIILGINASNELKNISNDKTRSFNKNVYDKFLKKRKHIHNEISKLEKKLALKAKKIHEMNSKTMWDEVHKLYEDKY